MTILIVGNNITMLKELSAELQEIYPSATVVLKTDPLMAGKYSCGNSVDMLVTELEMKRMNGIQLVDFVHHEHPNIPAYLIVTKSDLEKSDINENAVTGIIVYPFTDNYVKNILNKRLI